MSSTRLTHGLGFPVLLCLMATHCWAAGLGELVTHSNLGDSFYGKISLLGLPDADNDTVKAGIASFKVYQSLGLEYDPALAQMQLTVENNGQEGFVILTTSRRVLAPILNIVVLVETSGGKLQRSYSVLLDLPGEGNDAGLSHNSDLRPTISQSPQPGVAVGNSESTMLHPDKKAVSKMASGPRHLGQLPPVAVAAAKPSNEMAIHYGPVQRGESLSSIAKRMALATHLNESDVMQALWRENPDAFINGNIDLLRQAAILKLTRSSLPGNPVVAAEVLETTTHAESSAEANENSLARMTEENKSLRERIAAVSLKLDALQTRIDAETSSAESIASTAPQSIDESGTQAEVAATSATLADNAGKQVVQTVKPAPVTAVTVATESAPPAKKTNVITSSLFVVLALILIIALGFLLRSYRMKQRAARLLAEQDWLLRKRSAREMAHASREQLHKPVMRVKKNEAAQAEVSAADSVELKLQYVRTAVDTFLLFQRYREALEFLQRELHVAGGEQSALGQRIVAIDRETRAHLGSIGFEADATDVVGEIEDMHQRREANDGPGMDTEYIKRQNMN